MRQVRVGSVAIGGRSPLALLAGPCVIEDRALTIQIASRLVKLARKQEIPLIFKASYDKANRTSVDGFRGPGLEAGLDVLREIRERFDVPVVTDVHTAEEAEAAGRVVDMVQIPAFLCRQTDLVLAAADTGRVVNIKKGQFLAPEDMIQVVEKVHSRGNRKVLLTERGASFGYHNLVADMRSLLIMRELGCPVVFDATHSVQRPGAGGTHSGGDGRWARPLARAAVATGCDALFIETHPDPTQALSDGANMIPLREMGALWKEVSSIDKLIR
jgi:2-dehydro-3-deoxyphosphooctonate aldolase (KDO 8-P synthase)